MPKSPFHAEMEERFGTEKALGIWFKTDDGRTLTVDELNQIASTALIPGEKIGITSYFPHGGSGLRCTDYAMHIFNALPGRVKIFGFLNEDNPTSRIARDKIDPCGHDFAIVDNRYIVDPWIRLVPMVSNQILFDFHNLKDAILIMDIYGQSSTWKRSTHAEEDAISLNKQP